MVYGSRTVGRCSIVAMGAGQLFEIGLDSSLR